MLALHQVFFAILAQDQINAAVGAFAAGFGDAVSLAPKGLAYQQLELLPAEAINGLAGLGSGLDVVKELFAALAADYGADGAEYTYQGDKVSAEHGEGLPELAEHHAGHVLNLHTGRYDDRPVGHGIEDQPADKTDKQADPPGQTGQNDNNIFKR